MSFAKRLFSHKIDVFEKVVTPPPKPVPIFENELRITTMTRNNGGASFTPGVTDITEEQGMCSSCNSGMYSLILRRKVVNYESLDEEQKQELTKIRYEVRFTKVDKLNPPQSENEWQNVASLGHISECVQDDSNSLGFATSTIQAHNGNYYILNKWLCNIPKESNVTYRGFVLMKNEGEENTYRVEHTNTVTKRCVDVPEITVNAKFKRIIPQYKFYSACYEDDMQVDNVVDALEPPPPVGSPR